jgi:hypothetical protein
MTERPSSNRANSRSRHATRHSCSVWRTTHTSAGPRRHTTTPLRRRISRNAY